MMPTTEWNPMRVGLERSIGGSPYASPGNNLRKANEVTTPSAGAATPATGTVGPESVRASGSGPGDATWRQNLATFSGGQFQRPGGFLSFDPTSAQPFGGAPTGGGTAPLFGLPSTLLSMALGGQPFSFSPSASSSQQPQSTGSGDSTAMTNSDWLARYMGGGRMVNLA